MKEVLMKRRHDKLAHYCVVFLSLFLIAIGVLFVLRYPSFDEIWFGAMGVVLGVASLLCFGRRSFWTVEEE